MTFLDTELVDARLLVTHAALHIPSVLALAAFSVVLAAFAFQLPLIGIKRCSLEVPAACSACLRWWIASYTQHDVGGILLQKISLLFIELFESQRFVTDAAARMSSFLTRSTPSFAVRMLSVQPPLVGLKCTSA